MRTNLDTVLLMSIYDIEAFMVMMDTYMLVAFGIFSSTSKSLLNIAAWTFKEVLCRDK